MNSKSFLIGLGSTGIMGFLGWLLMLPIKLILKDKFSLKSAVAGYGITTALAMIFTIIGSNGNSAFNDLVDELYD